MNINYLQERFSWLSKAIGVFLIVYTVSLLIYTSNRRVISAVDTIPARYLSLSLLREGNLDLNEFAEIQDYKKETGLLATYEVNGRLLSSFPVGSAFFGALFYKLGMNFGLSTYDNGLIILEKWAAANIMALASGLFWILLLGTGAPFFSRFLAWAAFAFASPNWTPCSQGLWQHGSAEVMLIASLLFLIFGKENSSGARYLFSGVFLGLSVFMRPTTAALLPVWAVLIFWEKRKTVLYFIIGALIGIIPIIIYHVVYFGNIFGGGYFRLMQEGRYFSVFRPWYFLMAHLFSPSRGVLIFMPIFILSVFSFFPKFREHKPERYDARLWGFSALALLCVVISYKKWWSGYGYGPRYWAEMIPFLCLLLLPSLNFLIKKKLSLVIVLLLLGYCVFIQALGAWRYDEGWDGSVKVDKNPEACWNVYNSVIFYCLTGGASNYGEIKPADEYNIYNKIVKTSDKANERFLYSGFYESGDWGVWTRGVFSSTVLFNVPEKQEGILILKMVVHGSPLYPKQIKIFVNENFVSDYIFKSRVLNSYQPENLAVTVPGKYLKGGVERLTFECSHANYIGSGFSRYYGFGLLEFGWLSKEKYNELVELSKKQGGMNEPAK